MRSALLLLLLFAHPLLAQDSSDQQGAMASEANAVFAVATIKPSDPNVPGKGTFIRGRRYSTLNTTVSYLIQYAYGYHARQIVDGPGWLDRDKYDLAAIPQGEGLPSDAQWRTMVQNLLVERFGLKFHHGLRELSVYRLTVAKGGSKLTASGGDPDAVSEVTFGRIGGVVRLPGTNATMADFIHVMQRNMVDRPIVDQTKLTGRYGFVLSFTPDDYQGAQVGGGFPPPGEDAPPGLFTAVEQQMGLKFEAVRIQADVIVIDHLEKPASN